MLKKILGLLLIGLTTLGITQAQVPGITTPTFTISNGNTNTYNGITTSFDPNANFTSDTYTAKALFYNYNTSYAFKSATFWNNGKLYIVSWLDSGLKWQGYAYLCKVESTATNQFCRTYYNEGDPSLTQYYIEQYANPDYFQFYGYNNPHIGCFVYEELGEKLCFGVQQDNSNGLDTTTQLFNTVPTGYNDPRFAELAGDSYWSNNGGGETTTINYACPTIQQLINTYPNQYNTGLCYSSSLVFSGGKIQQVEPKDIFTLYPQYTGFVTDINLYNNYCVGPNTQTACETAFKGKTEQYTLISKIPDNVKKANLYAYCNLQLNYEDKNASTCVTSGAINTGEYIPPITNQGVIDELIDGDYNIVLPASGYVMDTLKDEDGERKIDRNIIESIQNLYSKFTTIFTGREGNNGIIPEYITRMLLVIILFAFFKK